MKKEAGILKEILQEEMEADKVLAGIAVSVANPQAVK
jgi:hypothetical protein